MRIGHRRSLFGYSSKAVAEVIDSMREEFEETKKRLQAELNEYNQAFDRMTEEINLRKEQLNELPDMEPPRLVFSNKKIN